MRNSSTIRLMAVAATVALAACGDDTSEKKDGSVFDLAGLDVKADQAGDAVGDGVAADVAPAAATLDIGSGMKFTTAALEVAPGAVITVKNNDSVTHTVTSESAPNAFSPSGTFDTGDIAAGGTATIHIPANATVGTVFHFYCKIHTSAMQPANGTITVK